mmetsp:Transcript_32832/g.50218  ORF Transcript_32832/g.50218 Transcript_32832/m.50218 type:complete len:279 (+) Transcript_32832:98-934(+)
MCGVKCIAWISALLLLASNGIKISILFKSYAVFEFSVKKWQAMRTEYLEALREARSDARPLLTALSVVNLFSWFFLGLLLIQVAWILSRGGKRKVGMHTFLGVTAVAAAFIEIMGQLMIAGREQMTRFFLSNFEINKWLTQGSEFDYIGDKAYEVCYIMVDGLMMWIDAFEWFALFMITFVIMISTHSMTQPPLSQAWAAFGMMVGSLSFVDVLANLLRLGDFATFQVVAGLISVLNTVLLLPIWVLWLGRQLATTQMPPVVKGAHNHFDESHAAVLS